MCGIVGSIVTIVVGAALVVISSTISYLVVPDIIEDIIINSVVLTDGTLQMERFKEVPFSINFTVYVFNISNPEVVLNGGVAVVNEVGPYTYRLYQSRNVTDMEEDKLKYRRIEYFVFDAEASFPNTEDDILTIINVPYHGISQIAEQNYPQLISLLSLAMNDVFGNNNSPIVDVKVGDLVRNGVPFCQNPGIIGSVACAIIRTIAAGVKNVGVQEDGSLVFSILEYKQGIPSGEYEIYRGLANVKDLGRILTLEQKPHFSYWRNYTDDYGEDKLSVCNMINGTDAAIFPPFVDREEIIYAINTDVCRSVELRYQYDLEYEGISAVRYSANEWFLDNDDGCFCLNVTSGIVREDGCPLRGAMELYSCVGAYLVLSYPHFLYADSTYRNGVLGMRPIEEDHRIYMDIEPITGTPITGAKRAQFNIFSRPVTGISATQNLRTTLMPIFWIQESYNLPEDFVEELKGRLIRPLNLVSILVPVIITICCVVLLVGVALTIRAKMHQPAATTTTAQQKSE